MSDGKFEKVCSQTTGETSSPPVPTSPGHDVPSYEEANAEWKRLHDVEEGVKLEVNEALARHAETAAAVNLAHAKALRARNATQDAFEIHLRASRSRPAQTPSTDRSLPVRGAADVRTTLHRFDEYCANVSDTQRDFLLFWDGGTGEDDCPNYPRSTGAERAMQAEMEAIGLFKTERSEADVDGEVEWYERHFLTPLGKAVAAYLKQEIKLQDDDYAFDRQASQQDAPRASSDGDQINPAPQEERGEQKNDLVSAESAIADEPSDDAHSPVIPEREAILGGAAEFVDLKNGIPAEPMQAIIEFLYTDGSVSMATTCDLPMKELISESVVGYYRLGVMKHFWQRGANDRHGGVEINACPFSPGSLAALKWRAGWQGEADPISKAADESALPESIEYDIAQPGPARLTSEVQHLYARDIANRAAEVFAERDRDASPDERPRSDAEGEHGSAARETSLHQFLHPIESQGFVESKETTDRAIEQKLEDLDQDDLTRKAKEPEMEKA